MLRTAVVGLGRIGWSYHVPEVVQHQGFSLVSVADASYDRLDEAAQTLKIPVYNDYRQMIEEQELDLIVIASPTVFHMEQAVYAMQRGLDVLLEKPMACNLEEADYVIHTMKRHGRKLVVYQPARTTSEMQAIQHVIASQRIGKVYMIKRACSDYVRRNDWQSLNQYGGGMLNNYGAHYIDQTLCITGSSARNISCCLKKIASRGDADDVVKLVIETMNHITLDIDINMASAVQLTPWVVLGEYGSLTMEYRSDGDIVTVRYLRREELSDLQVVSELAAPGRTYDNHEHLVWHNEMVKVDDFKPVNFYQKCYGYFALDELSFVPVEETREVMRIISECRKQQREEFCHEDSYFGTRS